MKTMSSSSHSSAAKSESLEPVQSHLAELKPPAGLTKEVAQEWRRCQTFLQTHQTEHVEWRQSIHAHPETAFEEIKTAAFVAQKLRQWGLEVTEGLAKTGVVGVLRAQEETRRRVGLRADLDALPMTEEAHPPYRSRIEGKMHACGHDGHTIMLLAAARYLSQHPRRYTEVVFIFQPAEENLAGGRVMVD